MTVGLNVVILAAGQGKRMNNPDMAKVLYPVGGKPMIDSGFGLRRGHWYVDRE